MVSRIGLAAVVFVTGCARASTEQLIALEAWSAWSAERVEMTFVANQVRLVDRRTDPVGRWQGRLTQSGQDALADVDRLLLTSPIPHDACMSHNDGHVLTVRFEVGGDQVAANACPEDPRSPYADAWDLYSELAAALVECTDTDWISPNGDCEVVGEL